MKFSRCVYSLVFSLQFLAGALVAASEYSQLWGEKGEKWVEGGRLPDFSFAGYAFGEKPLPDYPVVTNVKDFGAVGDGVADDTAAIKKAIEATQRGAILVPAGRYVITDIVRIKKSGVVLRGAGPQESVLYFPKGLDELFPKEKKNSSGKPTSAHSFSGGFLTVEGELRVELVTPIVAVTRRGDRTVTVADASKLKTGQRVVVGVSETPDHSLKTYLYNDDPGDIRKAKQLNTQMVLRIVSVKGEQVTFDRPLRFETRAEWKPEIRSFNPTVEKSGVESLGFEFPEMRYRGHFAENGANAIELKRVTNCWVRNVRIHNADLGVNVVGSHNTVDGVLLTASEGRPILVGKEIGMTGHHGIQCKGSEDNLVTRFDFRAPYLHDLSVEDASGNVFSQGRGVNLCLDHHKDMPYENLFTDIDCGLGLRIWMSGGGASLGRPSAGWGTLWNVRADRPLTLPPPEWGVRTINIVGLATEQPSQMDLDKIWLESIPPAKLYPQDLYQAQLKRRLNR
jgi:hypothetical protein